MPEPSTALKLDCTVSLNRPLAAGVQLMRLHCPELAESIEPGQFFDLHVPGDPTHMLRLPFSYSHADPESGEVEFAFRIRGEGTERLAGLPEGTATDLLGPAGKGWTVPEGVRKALLVSGGRGIVTLISLAEELSRRLVPFHLVQGASIAAGIVFTERAEELAGSAAAVRPVTEDGSVGTRGLASEVACELIAGGGYDVVYACGPDDMMAAVAAACKAAGVPCQVSMERLMACGFGACTTCLVDTVEGRKGACKEGPVFDAEKVIW